MPDPYDILGVPRDATEKQIRKAYRRLAADNHPDRGGNPERFHQIAAAHEILSDPDKRRIFDETGAFDAAQQWAELVQKNVHSLINALLDEEVADIEKALRLTLKRHLAQLEEKTRRVERRIERTTTAGERITALDPDSPDPIHQALKLRREKLDRELAELNFGRMVTEDVRKIIDGYRFEKDESPTHPGSQSSSFFTSTITRG